MPIPSSVLLIGYGSIGQGLTPLLLKHFDLQPSQVTAIAADENGRSVSQLYGVRYINLPLTPQNYEDVLCEYLCNGDWLINVAVEVSSVALIAWCREVGVLYLDTCVEPWPGGYQNFKKIEATTNYALRHEALSLSQKGAPTAVIAHGANPGLVSHFVKIGLHELAKIKGIAASPSWADVAQNLGVKIIQIAERDTHHTRAHRPINSFVNTWSVDGLIAEARQCAELGWGSHEMSFPENGRRHDYGDRSGIYLEESSARVKVKSWVPAVGEQWAYMISHHESLSIANFLTMHGEKRGEVTYRPTVYYAYHPSEMTCQSLEYWLANDYANPKHKCVLRDELESGFDQLGVLFVFSEGAYWYGSTLDIERARKLAPHNNGTSLQVVAGILGALVWMNKHPEEGVVEAESINFEEIMQVAIPYLGNVFGVLSDWQPRNNGTLQFHDFLLSKFDCKEVEIV